MDEDQVTQTVVGEQRTALRSSLYGALLSNPDAAARATRLGRATGLPTDTVERNLETVQRNTQLNEFDRLIDTSPAVAQFLSTPEFARLAHDDVENLSTIETMVNSFRRGVPGLQQGLSATGFRANAGILANVDAIEEKMRAGLPILDTEDPYAVRFMSAGQRDEFRAAARSAAASNAADIAQKQGEKAAIPTPAIVGQVLQAKTFGEAFRSFLQEPVRFVAATGPESLVQSAPGLVAAVPAGLAAGPAGAVAAIGGGSFVTDYGSSILDALGNAGVDLSNPAALEAAAKDEALMRRVAAQAMAHALVVGAVDAASGGLASKVALPAKVLAGRPGARELANLGIQIPAQGLAGGAGELGGEIAAGQDISPGNILAEIVGEAFGAPAEVASASASVVRARMQKAEQAEQTTQAIEQFNSLAAASKVLERDPDTFGKFIEQATADGPVQDVYIGAEALAQSGALDQVLEASPSAQQQFATALETGTDIRIPVAEYASTIAGQDYAQSLIDHLKVDPAGFSRAEAQEIVSQQGDALKQQVEEAITRSDADTALQTSRDAVQAKVLEQLTAANRFTPEVNSQYATLTGAFYATQAARLGTTPEALFEQYPLRIQAQSPVGEALSQQQRGAFSPPTSTITLLKAADLSTFLHESGHFNLETLGSMAAQPNAPVEIQQDMQTLLEWFGVKEEAGASALQRWQEMSLDERRAGHEQFARGFEAYLFEGKAPSVELRGIFQRFRAWLVNVYRQIKALNVELTPDVRGVMDRMLATADQIQGAEAGAGMGMLFKTPEEAKQFGVEWAKYHEQGLQATQDAITELEARGLKDMQWLQNARGRELKKLQKLADSKRRDVRSAVRVEVLAEPVYQAWQFLTSKEEDSGRLKTEDLRQQYGTADDAPWRALSALGMTSDSRGTHPDVVAERFQYDSADAMVQALAGAIPLEQEIENRTDQRMLELYGDITSPEALERAANEAIHNAARARFVAAELKALEAAQPKEQGTDKKGRPRSAPILPAAAKQFAADLIARQRVRDVRPAQFQAAEARAGREAEKALKAGDVAGAAREKRNQLINHYAVSAAQEAQRDVEKALRYFGRVEGSTSIDASYRQQIEQLLERYSLKRESLKDIDRRTSLKEWVAQQEAAGIKPDIPAALLEGIDRRSYRDMTVEELRGLVDTVKQIEHIGRLKHKLLTARDDRAYEAVRDEIAASIEENARGRTTDPSTPPTRAGKWFRSVRAFGAAHIKAATWARILDGTKDGGPMWEHIIRSANERADQETTMRAAATKRLSEIMAPVLKSRMDRPKFFSSIGRSLTREGVFAMALNTGNASNLQRLLGGRGWTIEQVRPVLDTLSAEDWQAVQAVWDYFETFRPLIGAKERRVNGVEPKWIDAAPVVTKHGTFRGGYFPVVYDPDASGRAEEHADAEEAREQLKGAYSSATTRRSFTKARVEEVHGRPLLLELQGLYGGINDVIHDLAWHEWLIDTNRLMKSDKIDEAIRTTWGPAVVRQFKTWREDIATGDRAAQGALEKAVGRVRRNVSMAGLALNFLSALKQPLGFTQSAVRIGPTWLAKGLQQYVGAPLDQTRHVQEQSEFMRNRARTRFRELNELRNRVQGAGQWRDRYQIAAYFMMLKVQQMVDVPTWLGAYEKAMADDGDDARAIALADQAVIDSQGGGQIKDLAAIERGGAFTKVFTTFYTFMNTTLNLAVAQGLSQKSAAAKAADMVLLYSVPAILGAAITDLFTPGGDEPDEEELIRKLISVHLEAFLGNFVLGREFAASARIVTGSGGFTDYNGPAGLRVIPDATALATQIGQAEFDEALMRAALNLGGSAMGLPAAQINKTISGTEALAEGETENPAALVFGFQR